MSLTGMILAAGYGTRLRPLTDHLPKPLFPVLGRPIIWHQAKLLHSAGVLSAVVNVHHLPEMVEEFVASGGLGFLEIAISRERGRILGTGGGIRNARRHLDAGTAIVVNGDTLLDANLEPLLEFHRSSGALATMLLQESPGTPDEHSIFVDKNGGVRRMAGLGEPPGEFRRCAFLGVHVIEPALFDYLPDEGCIIREGYRKAADDGKLVAGFVADAVQRDIGTPAALLDANLEMLNDRFETIYEEYDISDNKIGELDKYSLKITEPIFCGPGGCLFDPDVELGPGAVLTGENVIGAGARVVNSLVLHGEKIKPGESLERIIAGFGLRIKA